MFLKVAQHPIHYVIGSITHAPLVMQAWAQEDPGYKLRWIGLYAATLFIMSAMVMGLQAGIFMAVSCLLMIGFMSAPTILAMPKGLPFTQRFSEAYLNGVLAWHAFFISIYLVQTAMIFLTSLSGSWSPSTSMWVVSAIASVFCAFSLQMASSLTRRMPQWAVPVGAASMGVAVHLISKMYS
ncbi:hypothetical protein RBE51_18880 [Pseudomonas taiwanensis]|uniref:hypothetical protein n=1 Tax=Pseudomonas taiwanensis TaxID=470150 RepID=UPI0028DD607C|nr:hypothetical protein [Pseudomonas taiwanensis]MDT8924854.1 hypothetical protein [Pseudomonas taiwanensis]